MSTYRIGEILTAMVIDENVAAYFVQVEGQTYQLPKVAGQAGLTMGEMVKGFVYENQQRKLMMTQKLPTVTKEQFDFATVTKVQRGLGVFVDIGLPDKDIVVSMDDLPAEQKLWPKVGNKLYVRLKEDKKRRLWAELAQEKEFIPLLHRPTGRLHNQTLTACVFRLKLTGTHLITEEGHFRAFLHPNERLYEPTLGEVVSVRVIGVKPDYLNVSMRPRAYEAIEADARMILAHLYQRPQHSLPYSDRSHPEDIKAFFGISKGQFKRAVGHLLKQRLIRQEANGIYLVETEQANK